MTTSRISTFIFPAIVDRGDVVVAIGTAALRRVARRRVREKIEAVLPARIGDLPNSSDASANPFMDAS